MGGSVGAAFYGLTLLPEAVVHLDEMTAIRTGGALLAVAGASQPSPLTTICLRQRRSPMTVIMQHAGRLAPGHRGPVRVGVAHGTLGCCWSLMVVLVLLGMMSLAWMATGAAIALAPHTVHLRG